MMCCINCHSVFDEPRHRASLTCPVTIPTAAIRKNGTSVPAVGATIFANVSEFAQSADFRYTTTTQII